MYDSETFTWNVTPASPSIENADDDEWDDLNDAEGQAVSIPVIGSDPDNLSLTYSATGLPPGLTINGSTGIISGTVAAGADTGTDYDVTVSVTNGLSTPATLEFPWTITQLALAPPSDRFNVTGDTINLPILLNNPRGGTLSYSADDLPDGLSIDPFTGVISGVIAGSAAGGEPWLVTIDVTDGTETAEHTFNWTVWPGNPTVTIQDGGFETPALGSGNAAYAPAGSAWTFTGAAGLTGNDSAFATGGQEAPQGQQAAFLQGAGSAVSQTIAHWGAGSYHVTFAASQRPGSSQDFQVLIDGHVVATFQPQTGSRYLYYTTPAFSVAAGDHTLTFQGTDTQGGDNTVLLDGTDIIPATAGVPVINDPSFEQATIGSGGYAYNPSDSYWDFEGQAGVSGDGTDFTINNPASPDGSHVGFLQGTGSFIQAVTDWSSGTYQVSFAAAQRARVNSAAGEDLQILLDGVVVGNFTPSGTSYQTYTTPDFTVTAGTHSLAFRGLDTAGGDNTAFLDKITVSTAGGSSLPTSGSAGLPVISLTNPGSQVNLTDDVIALPTLASASADDIFSYSATGLPDGLSIDPDTGVISGMDDDFNAAPGTTYQVTVTLSDEYGQTTTRTFSWTFNADPSAGTTVTANGVGGTAPLGADAAGSPIPGQHPTTESRTDNFSNDGFWQNVEKLPGGLAAENWLLSQNGQVDWGWTLSVTHGRWEKQGDGSLVPVVHIPWQNDEANAAEAFVINVTQSWVIGFAAYATIPTDGSPADWQTYIKARTKAIGQVATTGAELYLSGASIVNEGVDWVVTLNDISKADSVSGAAVAALGFLPFVTNSTIKIVNQGKILAQITSDQRKLVSGFAEEYAKVQSFGIVGRVKPSGTVDNNLRAAYIKIAKSPQFLNNLTTYNKLAKFLGQKPTASLDDIIQALGNDVTFAKVPSNVLAAIFVRGDKSYLGPRPTMYYLQGNLSSVYGARAARHELVHLGAAINGQTNKLLHEIAVQAATTPEVLILGGGTLLLAIGGVVYEVSTS